MARPRTINREHLLDLAEQIVAATGAAGLSFGSVATLAGLSKASVQSVFVTREGLIEAILARWMQQEQAHFAQVAGPAPSRRARVRAHITVTAAETTEHSSRVAALLAALAGSGQQGGVAAQWYAARMGDFSARNRTERRQRVAFLAAEGAYYIRHLAGVEMSDSLWQEIFDDLLQLEDGQL